MRSMAIPRDPLNPLNPLPPLSPFEPISPSSPLSPFGPTGIKNITCSYPVYAYVTHSYVQRQPQLYVYLYKASFALLSFK